MGGQSAQKGYLFQTLICLLDALADESWDYFTLEPDEGNSKVDIFWKGDNSKAIQVKHSINKFTYSEAEHLAEEIVRNSSADSYELVLLGAHADKLNTERFIKGVKIHPARQVFIQDLIEQAAHRIDLYLEDKGSPPVPPRIRVLLCSALITKLTESSITGEKFLREKFDNILLEWIVSLYPGSIAQALEMQCHVLTNTINFIFNNGRLELLLPMEFANQNETPAIIESLAIVVKSSYEQELFFAAWTCHDLRTIANTHQTYNEFLVSEKGSRSHSIGFIPSTDVRNLTWTKTGKYYFSIYLKYRDREAGNWMKEKKIYLELVQENIDNIKNKNSFFLSYFPDLPSLENSLTTDTPNVTSVS